MFKLKRFIIAILAICIAATSSIPVFAMSQSESTVKSKQSIVLEDKVDSISIDGIKRTINKIKNVQDFSGDTYQVVECSPKGYLIYHPATAVVVESSPSSYSPFLEYDGNNLFYGGPTEYYIKTENEYVHTVINETITLPVDIERMRLTSIEISDKLEAVKDVALLDYMATGNQLAYATSKQANTGARGGNLSSDEVNWFKGLTQCGYFEGPDGDDTYGCCGFIGLNIIYAFFDKFVDTKYMPDSYWTSTSKTLLKNWDDSFTKVLHDLDPKDGTTSMHIHSVSKQYLKNESITDIDHTSRYWGFFSANTIKGILDNGYPVELFGNLADPPNYNGNGKKGGHAVVAYQYTTTSGTQYVCHYGWDGYTEVTIVGTLGSIYAMEVK